MIDVLLTADPSEIGITPRWAKFARGRVFHLVRHEFYAPDPTKNFTYLVGLCGQRQDVAIDGPNAVAMVDERPRPICKACLHGVDNGHRIRGGCCPNHPRYNTKSIHW